MKQKFHAPPVPGMRIIKSVVACIICFALYFLGNRHGIPFYSAIAALWCMQPYAGSTKKMAVQRTIGTLVGALYGLIVLLIQIELIGRADAWEYYMLSALASGAVLYTTYCLNRTNTSYFSCVVFFSITVMHMTDNNPWIFVWNRILDTMIGIAVGVAVNRFELPRKRRKDILLVSGLDGTILGMDHKLTPYSKFVINQMLQTGAKYTISTNRTPASVMEAMSGVMLKYPIIAMDGAVLYDIKDKRYLIEIGIPHNAVHEIENFFERNGLHSFINATIDHVLVIFYDRLKNDAEKDIYRKCRVSPYRTYVNRKYYTDKANILYFMCIHRTEVIEPVYRALLKEPFCKELKVKFYPSEDYPGYSYIKVYNRNASERAMIVCLAEQLGVSEYILCGNQVTDDLYIPENNSNHVVKSLYAVYRPLIWKKTKIFSKLDKN